MTDDPGEITWAQLKAKAKAAGLKGYATMNREDLLQALGLPSSPGASPAQQAEAMSAAEPERSAALIRIDERMDVLELVEPKGKVILAMGLNGVIGQGQMHKVRALKEEAARRGYTVTCVVRAVYDE